MINTDYLSLSVQAGSVDLLDGVVLERLAIISRASNQHVPVGELIISDPASIFKKSITVSDGLPVTISIGPSKDNLRVYNMRLFTPKVNPNQSGMHVRLVMYMDYPMYFGATTTNTIQDTSSGALSQIANSVGLQFVGDDSQDQQVWIPMGQRWCAFANQIARAGWNSGSSLFKLGITHDGVLVYRNVGEYDYGSPNPMKLGILTSDGSFIPCLKWETKAVGGFQNFRGAYSASQINQSVLNDTPGTDYQSTVNRVRATQFLNMNANVKSTLADGKKIRVSPIDSVNTHSNYLTAIYQNERLDRTNSMRLATMTMLKTNLDILDPVSVSTAAPPNADGSIFKDMDTDGFYFVDTKTVYAGPEAIYCEKFELLRDGHMIDPEQAGRDV